MECRGFLSGGRCLGLRQWPGCWPGEIHLKASKSRIVEQGGGGGGGAEKDELGLGLTSIETC